jgi:hypothetical protein
MKKVLASLFISLFLSLGGASAHADDSSTKVASATGMGSDMTTEVEHVGEVNENQATINVNPSAFSLDKFYAGFYGSLQGSKLNNIGSPYELSASGNPTQQAMTLASDVTAAYLITPDIGIGTYIEMNITPVLGQGITMLDVGLTTFNRKLVYHNGLTIFANAIVEAPVDTYDIQRGMIVGLETTPYIRYELPHSRFSVGAWTELKNYTGATSGKLVKTYYNPYVAYQILPQLSANFGYELEYDYFAHSTGMSVYETDLQPGLLLFITPKLIFNPYVQWFTNNRLTMDSAAFGASLVARIL